MFTEIIASWKLVSVKGREMYMVCTVTGKTIWVMKTQFDTNAETITYSVKPTGTEYIGKDGKKAKTTTEQLEFKGCGKQIVKKHTSLEVMQFLVSQGVTPSFNM